MTAPDTIIRLVEKFTQNREAYRSGKYNEAQLRQEFLDPFFEAIGWDVYNKKDYAPDYREVVVEDSLEIEGASKAPDYAFRIGGARKFFVEAKKPRVDIQYDIHPAYQLRRYAWNAHLPLSILTDFEELAVYNCTNKPNPSDSAATGRDRFYRFTEYIEKWDEITGIFSPEAILKGSFDRFAAASKGKKGTTEVDDAILADIEEWRKALAQNIALRNQGLISDERQVNYAVQMTIDRILFLRICEDRGIEPDDQIKDLSAAPGVYPRLVELFRRADTKYNSGLFHFEKENGQTSAADTFTPSLSIDDKVLKDIVKDIYYPCPYIFKEIPVEILGQVYERFLGKVIHLTAGHQARIEEKPEVRKAGGVYYTPQYIVDYIVANTVGKLLEGKTPEQAAALKIVDPACGSGSFLLGAYQYLLDWHERWYEEHDPERWARGTDAPLMPSQQGGYRLTTRARKEILVNNIHGVDIDPQAVEVTKLSLLLKVLEEESGQLTLGFERALPDLSRNIQCGNSLIGEDYFEGQLVVDEAERRRVNPFDWRSAFPQVFAKGGFDAVIGNPPYGAELDKGVYTFLKQVYSEYSESFDSFELFLNRGHEITKNLGRLGMIIPASWLTGEKYKKSRKKMVSNFEPVAAYAMPFDVFESAYIDTAIVIFAHDQSISTTLIHYFPKKEKLSKVEDGIGKEIKIDAIRNDETNKFSPLLSTENFSILSKLKGVGSSFGDNFEIQRGIQPYSRAKHTEKQIKAKFLHATEQLSSEYLPELQGNELSRYQVSSERASYIHYCDQIASSRSITMFQGGRLVIRRLLTRKFRLQASFASETMITTDNVLNAVPRNETINLFYSLGILNSRLISWMYVNSSSIAQKDDFPQVFISALNSLPLPLIDASNPADVKRHEQMVALVTRMLELHKRKPSTPQESEQLAREIESTDRAIDRLVYELYGLTEEEVRVVEGGE